MNILKKISTLLVLAMMVHSPLMAQKKLALANECFNSKAYYLASRYYQEFFGSMNDCHPDQLKMAQSLAATQQLAVAETVFHDYLNCSENDPAAYLTYGKFLMNLQAYEKAIPYFEKAMQAEPQLARHYILACRMALPDAPEAEGTSVFVNQVTESAPPQSAVAATMMPISAGQKPTSAPAQSSTVKVVTDPAPVNQTASKTSDINLYDAIVSAEKVVEKEVVVNKPPAPSKPTITYAPPKPSVMTEAISNPVTTQKTISPYGIRLGTYQDADIPDVSSMESYGTIEQKRWNGKIILFLVDFSDRTAAEAAVAIARQNNFRSATLVKKLASGRMKSVR